MKLQFTNGYRPRFDQISRILQFLLTQEGQNKIPRQDIVDNLGIPEKQVENLTSMMTGFGLVQSRVTTLTPLGKAIIQADPFFDKVETLWIIHYIVSSNPEWVVWYRIINKVIPSQNKFEVEKVSTQYFSDLDIHFSARTISEKLPKEVGAVFAAYTRTQFSKLNILEQERNGIFIRSTPVDIPSSAFMYCVLNYRDRFTPGSSAMNIADIVQLENSPGRVFHLSEFQIRTILGNLHSASLIRLEQFANLDQIRFSNTVTMDDILERIYGGQDAD